VNWFYKENGMNVSLDLRILFCLEPIELPVFNPVALDLLRVLNDPAMEIDDVVRMINEDQALSAQVLKMSNSPAYMGRVKCETIRDSALRLGTRQVTNLAMAASQASLHASVNPVVNDVMQDLWLHSHACALGSWSIALRSGHQDIADQAYMAGLLHDIGKLYILKALERMSQDGVNGIVLKRELILDGFGEMHVEMGCRLMDFWNIPQIYRAIVADHHGEYFNHKDVLLAIVRLVNFNSRGFNLSLSPPMNRVEDVLPEIGVLKLDDAYLDRLQEVMVSSADVTFDQ
jgi:HD-like signal output (HDOD) protein